MISPPLGALSGSTVTCANAGRARTHQHRHAGDDENECPTKQHGVPFGSRVEQVVAERGALVPRDREPARLRRRPSGDMRFIDRRRPTGRLIARASAVLAGVGILLVVAAPAASAHAVLESTTPTQAAVLTTAPTEVDLRFDESVEVALGAIRVLDSNGNRVDVGAAHHPNGSGRDVAVGLRSGLTNGTYLVSWRVISADSHPVGGTFTFSIGHAGAVASVTSSSGDHTVAVLFVVARFLGYAGLVVFVGGWLFTLLCRPPRTRALVGLTTIGWTIGLVGDVGALLSAGTVRCGTPAARHVQLDRSARRVGHPVRIRAASPSDRLARRRDHRRGWCPADRDTAACLWSR